MGRPSWHSALHLPGPWSGGDAGPGDHIVEETGREARERRKAADDEDGR
jgi:hypothetical protein